MAFVGSLAADNGGAYESQGQPEKDGIKIQIGGPGTEKFRDRVYIGC